MRGNPFIEWISEGSSKSCSAQNPSGTKYRPFFSPRKLEKLVSSLNFGTTTPSNYVSSREVQRETSIEPLPTPQISLHPRETFRFLLSFFSLFVSSDYFDEWIRGSKRAAFLTGSISREPPQFLWRRRMRTISFLPSRMDGRNFGGETTMMKVSNVFQPWALPVGGVILSFASRFFLFARKWTKIRRYQVSFIIGNYISLDIRVEILIQQGKETNEKYLPCLSKLIIT